MSGMAFSARLARRELRGGLAGFRIFLVCLALGVAGIAGVGSIAAAIGAGLAAEGRTILGGDAALTFTYRGASETERAWMDRAGAVSEVVDLRSMIGTEAGERALAQVKGVDGAYPLYGAVDVGAGAALGDALAERDGLWGLVTEPVLAERLGLSPGDRVRLGAGLFEFRGPLLHEPDRISGGFALGPRVIVATEGLRAAGLLGPGTLYETIYRLRLDAGADLAAMRADFEAQFPEAGVRFRDRANAAPGVQRFVERTGAFLTLVGLAALVVGGVGVGAAVRGYLTRKVATIAALRTLGASAGTVFTAYLVQIGVIAALGIAIGVALGGGAVALAGPWLAQQLPIPARFSLYPGPLALAALYGLAIAALFALWPLSWLREVRPAELFRAANRVQGRRGWLGWLPRPWAVAGIGALALGFGGLVVALSGAPKLATGVIVAIAVALVVLRGAGWLAARLARRLSHAALGRRRPGLRLALGAIGAPGGGTVNVVMALGLGLGVLAAIGQVDANMQKLIRSELPQGAPAFFFVDIQPDQIGPFRAMVEGADGVESIATAPMLRGVVTELNGIPAAEAPIDPAGAWVLRGDRGVTYAAEPPPGSVITEGAWWPADHSGEPLVSFAEEEGRELGLSIGSTVTVNILGRPITARVANFREVDWRSLGISFLMVLSPNALAGAPHTHIATVHAAEAAEAGLMRRTGQDYPNVTAIRVRDQITRISDSLESLGAATRWGALAVLLTGLAVLIGAAGAAAERQVAEAAVMKVLGAARARILGSFALRALLLGAIAGAVALLWGSLAAWAVTTFVLEADFTWRIGPALLIVGIGAGLNLLAGLAFSARPLRLRPARILRLAAG